MTEIFNLQPGDATRYTAVIDVEKRFLAIGAGDTVRGTFLPDYWSHDDIDSLLNQYTDHHYIGYFHGKTSGISRHTSFVGVLFFLMKLGGMDSEILPDLLKKARG